MLGWPLKFDAMKEEFSESSKFKFDFKKTAVKRKSGLTAVKSHLSTFIGIFNFNTSKFLRAIQTTYYFNM